jgi:hypothetical protein
VADQVWWIYIVVVVLLAAGIYAFVEVAGFRIRLLTRQSPKTAESMYDNYADSPGKQKRYASRRAENGETRNRAARPCRPGNQSRVPGYSAQHCPLPLGS